MALIMGVSAVSASCAVLVYAASASSLAFSFLALQEAGDRAVIPLRSLVCKICGAEVCRYLQEDGQWQKRLKLSWIYMVPINLTPPPFADYIYSGADVLAK